MKNCILILLLQIVSTIASADCTSAYEEQLSYFSLDTLGESYTDSAEFINSLLSNIPNKTWDSQQNSSLLSTTMAPTTTTTLLPAVVVVTPTSIAINAMDPESRYRETTVVYRILSDYRYNRDGGLTEMQMYVRLKSLGYSKSFAEMHNTIQSLNSSGELCLQDKEFVLTASELMLLLLAN